MFVSGGAAAEKAQDPLADARLGSEPIAGLESHRIPSKVLVTMRPHLIFSHVGCAFL